MSKLKDQTTTSRDLRKVRSNPQFFLNKLANIDWTLFVNSLDVDEMEEFWTTEITHCLNSIAPLKTRKPKTMSKYLKIANLVQCPEMTEMVCLIVRSYYSSGIGVQLALSKLLENDQDLMINCLGILRKLQISLLA